MARVIEHPTARARYGEPPPPAPRDFGWMIGIQAIALAIVVGLHGSPAWSAFRVAIALGISAGLIIVARAPFRRPAWTLLTAGSLGTIAGGSIGIRWLQKDGLSVFSVAALVAVATGLVLLVNGASRLIGSARGWRRLWALPIGLALLLLVFYPFVVALAVTNVPPTSLGSATPASRGLAYANVAFKTSDGFTLSGWYIPSKNRAAVVLLHGSGSTRSGVLSHAIVFAQHGYGVLLFDARGHGLSGGTGMDAGWYGDLDTRAAVSLLAARPDVDPLKIAAVGMSMGGEESIGAAASDTRIRAVVGEGVTGRVYTDAAEWLPHSWNGWIQRGVDRIRDGVIDLTTGASPPIGIRSALTATAPRPVLIINAGNVADERSAAAAFSRGLTNVQTWIVPGAAHTGGLATDPAGWTARVVGFLDGALGVKR